MLGHSPATPYTETVNQTPTPTPDAPDYLQRLNPEQRMAIETTDGPLLVLAGAGTGKTRVLTTRFAHILLSGRARPYQILAVTFTNKAAREMRERIGTLLGEPVEGLWLGTFHALCARMLRRHAEYVGLGSGFTILDTDDQLRLLKQVIEPLRIDSKRWPPQGILGVIQRWKDRGLTPERVTPAEDCDFANGQCRAIYASYQARLVQLNACDFGDLMLHVTEILRTRPDVLAQYHRLFRYILVDEYQDTNTIQYLWLRLLAQREGQQANICCVGDDDQSIYSWRGAEVENILRFERDFPGAAIVRLERNYRSTAQILGAASGLIAHNDGRLGKTLRPGREDASGDKVRVASVWDSDDEARLVGEEVERLRAGGHRMSEIAILVRAGFQTRAFEERLIAIGLPYRVVGGLRFYERAEIRDALAYMRVLNQPADDLAFERIVNVPRRGIGAVAMQKFHQAARDGGMPLTAAIGGMLERGEIKGKARDSLAALLNTLQQGREDLPREGHVVVIDRLLEESGYIDMWKADTSVEAPGRLDNLKELVRALADFESLGHFLEHVALVMENEESAGTERLSIMTLHGAKGLEFDTVFLPGWEEGVFPSQRTLDEGGLKGLEEERRLAYVGITRARHRAIISHAASRRIYGNWQSAIPSRFIEELPDEYVTTTGAASQARSRSFGQAPAFSSAFPITARRPRAADAAGDATTSSAKAAMAVGTRVFHQKFGYGTVSSVEGNRLEVAFDKAGPKRLLDSFVEKAP
ncbi:DNA helicase [Gluconacetobacter liquefaciens]|uniref:DNA 3'-5' helicase n=1 Tax=Gluconacetobacter liquefaciens TaxID=89584 RepID=A0A370G4I3_GLULI|nr:UvrD-helicase domain-containing protein [Gluconacetobacter liquefaciens]MBB2186182.1 UvrD-helicase domain-containing protein [Gluconacetobacter liquefaciens]RDI38718.1 DNA helicase-2/ATP-dependent DNA helicase PcrA [Gluconacetobacter liquefaciens]GEB36358.1 DNA helicase [Gluconacetobacter liquefaciens]